MRSLLLCRERLNRLLSVLDRNGGTCAFRDLCRTYAIRDWEIAQAEEAGWVEYEERKPSVGRPSLLVKKLSKNHAAKLPPPRRAIPKELSQRHWWFALESTSLGPSSGRFGCSLCSATRAYLIAYPSAKSKAGASASASRLLKKPLIRAARRWFMAMGELVEANEEMPKTAQEIHQVPHERLERQKQIW